MEPALCRWTDTKSDCGACRCRSLAIARHHSTWKASICSLYSRSAVASGSLGHQRMLWTLSLVRCLGPPSRCVRSQGEWNRSVSHDRVEIRSMARSLRPAEDARRPAGFHRWSAAFATSSRHPMICCCRGCHFSMTTSTMPLDRICCHQRCHSIRQTQRTTRTWPAEGGSELGRSGASYSVSCRRPQQGQLKLVQHIAWYHHTHGQIYSASWP